MVSTWPSPGTRSAAALDGVLDLLGNGQWHSREVCVTVAQRAAEPLGGLVRKSAYEITRQAIRGGLVQSRRVQGATGRVYEQLALPGVVNDRAGEPEPRRAPRRGRPAHYRHRRFDG